MTNIFRSTLKSIIALTFLCSTAFSADKTQLSDDVVSLNQLGVSFRKPNDWFNANEFQMVNNINKLDVKKEDIPKFLATHRGTLHLASFSKEDPSTHQGIIPTINVLVRQNPNNDFSSFMDAMKSASMAMGKILKNYTITQPVIEKSLSGKKVTYFVAEFDLSAADGKTYQIKSTTYSIPLGDVFIQLSMSEEKGDNSEVMFPKFAKAFEFKNN